MVSAAQSAPYTRGGLHKNARAELSRGKRSKNPVTAVILLRDHSLTHTHDVVRVVAVSLHL